MAKRVTIGIIVVAVLGVVLWTLFPGLVPYVFGQSGANRSPDPAPAQPPGKSTKIASVKVDEVRPMNLEDSFVLPGSIEPWEDITISAEVSGKIEWEGVEEGDSVETGQELIRIDTAATQARLAQAQAQYRLAAQELERARGSSKSGIGSSQDYDRARANNDVAKAAWETNRIQLDKSTVRAAIGGVVDKRFKDEGEYADMGAPLVRLVQVHKVKAIFGIPERDLAGFGVGDAVTVTVDALSDREFAGAIFRIATTAEAATRTFTTEVEVDNPEGLLKPGMVARARFVRETFPDAILIPFFTVLTHQDKQFVFVEQDGAAHMRPVTIGATQGAVVQITNGLAPGDRLIVVGQRDLSDGDPVAVQEAVQ